MLLKDIKLVGKTVLGETQMRRYVYLKEPVKINKKDYLYKIMLYQMKKDGVCLFMYCKKDA